MKVFGFWYWIMVFDFFKRGFSGYVNQDFVDYADFFMASSFFLDTLPRSGVVIVKVMGAKFVLKNYSRRIKPWRRGKLNKLKCRVRNEIHWLLKLESLAVGSPSLVLYVEREGVFGFDAIALMSVVEGRPIDLFEGNDLLVAAKHGVQAIAKLHLLGVAHGDCNLHNFIISDDVSPIDFEWAGVLCEQSASYDLEKFLGRLRQRDSSLNLDQVVESYLQVSPFPCFDPRKVLDKVRTSAIVEVKDKWRPLQEFEVF